AWSRSDSGSGSAARRPRRRHRAWKVPSSRSASAPSWPPPAAWCWWRPSSRRRAPYGSTPPASCLPVGAYRLPAFELAGDQRRRNRLSARPWDQHRHLLAIAAVLIAEQLDQVALLQMDADQNVAGGGEGEQQVADRHGGRRPEGDEEAQIDRMADLPVEQQGPEHGRRQRCTAQPGIDLAQPEQLEMIDEEGAEQHQ